MQRLVLVFVTFILTCASVVYSQERIDIADWHEEHPVALVEERPDQRLRLGLYPRLGAIVGIPNGIAGTFQLSLSSTSAALQPLHRSGLRVRPRS